jgi:hydrogenase maturation protease
MILVIGIGNPDRGDDAAGLAVARKISDALASGQVTVPGEVIVRELTGDQLKLLDEWAGATEVYLVDAVCSGGAPGTVYRFDAADALTERFRHRGTHTFSLADVIELARVLGQLPPHLAGFGIEGADFAIGAGLSPEAAAAVDKVTALLLEHLEAGDLAMCLGTTGVITRVHDDDGVPMALVDTGLVNTGLVNTGLVDTGTAAVIRACLLTCPEAVAGDTVLVHSGYVLQILDAQEESS